MGGDELQHPGQKTRRCGGAAYVSGLDAGDRQETLQELGVGGNEGERFDGDLFGGSACAFAAWRYGFQHQASGSQPWR